MANNLLNSQIIDFYSKILKRIRLLSSLQKKSKLIKKSKLSRDTVYKLNNRNYLKRKNRRKIRLITILKFLYGINVSPYCFFNFEKTNKEFINDYKQGKCNFSTTPENSYIIFKNNILGFKNALKAQIKASNNINLTDDVIFDQFSLIYFDINTNFFRDFYISNSSTLDTVFKIIRSLKIPNNKIHLFFISDFDKKIETKLLSEVSNHWKKII